MTFVKAIIIALVLFHSVHAQTGLSFRYKRLGKACEESDLYSRLSADTVFAFTDVNAVRISCDKDPFCHGYGLAPISQSTFLYIKLDSIGELREFRNGCDGPLVFMKEGVPEGSEGCSDTNRFVKNSLSCRKYQDSKKLCSGDAAAKKHCCACGGGDKTCEKKTCKCACNDNDTENASIDDSTDNDGSNDEL